MGWEKRAGRRGRGAGEPSGGTRGARGWERLGPAAEGRRTRTTVQRGVLPERDGGRGEGPGRDRSRADGVGGIVPYFTATWSAWGPSPQFSILLLQDFHN